MSKNSKKLQHRDQTYDEAEINAVLQNLKIIDGKFLGVEQNEFASHSMHQLSIILGREYRDEDQISAISSAYEMVCGLNPTNVSEAAMVVQIVAAHELALSASKKAVTSSYSMDVQNMMFKNAEKMMNLYRVQIEAYYKLKATLSKSNQAMITIDAREK